MARFTYTFWTTYTPVSKSSFTGGSTNYLILNQYNNTVFWFLIDGNNDISSLLSYFDNGLSWSLSGSAIATTATQIAVWYDRWSGIDSDYMHVVYTDANSDVRYVKMTPLLPNPPSWTNWPLYSQSSPVTIFNGASTAAGGTLSLTITRGGNLICCGCIDGGTEIFAKKSTDGGATWNDIAAVMESATQDQIILQPNPDSVDNQDCLCYYWDASADEISVKRYDDSGNSWAETSIAASMVDTPASTSYPHWCAAIDLINSQNVLVAWSAVDIANADLRCWKVTDGTITEVTNVILNSNDDQGLARVMINGNTWCVIYNGKEDGSSAYGSAAGFYSKMSNDQGTTWGSETDINSFSIAPLTFFAPMFYTKILITAIDNLTSLPPYHCIELANPHAIFQFGM